jgi:hypothetical protein
MPRLEGSLARALDLRRAAECDDDFAISGYGSNSEYRLVKSDDEVRSFEVILEDSFRGGGGGVIVMMDPCFNPKLDKG